MGYQSPWYFLLALNKQTNFSFFFCCEKVCSNFYPQFFKKKRKKKFGRVYQRQINLALWLKRCRFLDTIPVHSFQAWSCRGTWAPHIFPCKKYKRKTVVHHKSPNLTSFNYDLRKEKQKREQKILWFLKIIKDMGFPFPKFFSKLHQAGQHTTFSLSFYFLQNLKSIFFLLKKKPNFICCNHIWCTLSCN